ncbi:MAG: ParB N-terminal domain-containing protein [Cetobacterium sp.]
MDLSNNPLARREVTFELKPKIEKTTIERYGEVRNINIKIFEKIDLEDRTFVNRLDEINQIKNDENFLGLIESIRGVGLINPIYLFEKNEKYIVISGWRRSLALSEIFKECREKTFQERAIILKENTPLEILEGISIDENTKRKNLSLLELSYKFNRLSEDGNLSIEECLEKFKIGKSQFHAIKKAIEFEPEVKSILEIVGAVKGDLINKIVKLCKKEDKTIDIQDYSSKTRDELKEILDNFKISTKKIGIQKFKNCKIKSTDKNTIITINKQLNPEILEKILQIIEVGK